MYNNGNVLILIIFYYWSFGGLLNDMLCWLCLNSHGSINCSLSLSVIFRYSVSELSMTGEILRQLCCKDGAWK